MLLQNLQVVLVKTRFPENIGMAARACVNMGCPTICLVTPERWDKEKARPLATPKGQDILDTVTLAADLPAAVAQSSLVLGTTARTGGFRQALLSPEAAAREVAAVLGRGEKVSLVFGPEDRGLENDEVLCCGRLVTIPTDPAASSLNLAQAVLLLLYECAGGVRRAQHRREEDFAAKSGSTGIAGTTGSNDEGISRGAGNAGSGGNRAVTAEETARLMASLKEMLLGLDYLHGDNPDYFLLPWQRFLSRAGLRRHEYDALMGLCRQVRRKVKNYGAE